MKGSNDGRTEDGPHYRKLNDPPRCKTEYDDQPEQWGPVRFGTVPTRPQGGHYPFLV